MKRAGFLVAFILITGSCIAQISGSSLATPGQTTSYSYTASAVYGYYVWSISPYYGTVQSQSSSGTTYYVTILWNTTGTCTLSFSGYGQLQATKSITINCPTLVTPSTTFTYSTNSCGDKTITRSSNPPTGVTWYWQTSASGTDMTYPSNTFSASLLGTNTYFLRAKGACSSWSNALSTAGVSVNPVPASPGNVSNQSFPAGYVSLLPSGAVTNEVYRWYASASAPSPLSEGLSYYPLVLSTTNFYVSTRNTVAGCESARVLQTITITCSSTPSFSGPQDGICPGSSGNIVLQGSDSGTTFQLYINGNASGSSFQGNGGILQWAATVGNNYQVRGVSGTCSSYVSSIFTVTDKIPGTISISTNNSPPNTCIGNSITLTPQGGSNYSWSSSPAGATGSGSITVTPTVTTTYYLSGTESNCQSGASASVTISVAPKVGPVTITSGPTNFCKGSSSTSTFTASAANLNYFSWSLTPTGVDPSGAGTINSTTGVVTWNSSFTGSSATITATAYSANNCNHIETASRVVTLYSSPGVPNVSNQSFPAGYVSLTPSGAVTNEVYRWYVSASAPSPIAEGLSYSPSLNTTTTYFVSILNTVTGCESGRVQQIITITCSSSPSFSGPVGGICPGASGSIVLQGSDSATTFQLYINGNASGSSFQGNGGILQWPATVGYNYQVRGVSGTCSSYVSSIVTVTSKTPGSISISTNSVPPFLCIGNSITLTPQGGSNYSWSSNPAGASGSGSITVSPTVNTTYYLTGTESICQSGVSASLTISVAPKVGAVTITSGPTSFCQGALASSTYMASATNLNYFSWSLSPAGAGTISSTTGIVAWNSSYTGGTATVSVTAYSASSCNYTESASRVVTIYPTPGAAIVTTPIAAAYNTSISLTAAGALTGEVYRWYDASNTLKYTGTSFPTPLLTSGNSITYYVTRYHSALGCETPYANKVTQLINLTVPTPTQPVASTNTCDDKKFTFSAAPAGITWYWQTSSTGQLTTEPINGTTPYSLATSGTYYVRAKANTLNLWSSAIQISPQATIVNPVNHVVSAYDPLYPNIQATASIKLSPGFVVTAGQPFSAKIVISAECNNLVNWVEQTVFDETGTPISMSRSYSDGFGNPLESQSKDFLNNKVFGSQTLFNAYGVAVAGSMAAPIQETDFIYKKNLASNAAGQPYGATDFDLRTFGVTTGEINNPKPFGAQPGTVGWYYSSSNTLEPLTPTTQYPYSRSFTAEGPDPTVTTSAGPGDQHRMGSGHESKSERLLITTGELNHYFSLRPQFPNANQTNPTNLGYKYISTDPNGKRAVSFVDADGRALASATITSTGNAPFTYDNWSYTYYNDMGQVVATVAPKGVNTGSTALPNFVTYFKYDQLGRMIETTSIDEGTSRFVYALDGRIRFSENQVQRTATPKRFSYTNYDNLGRLIESGEYTGSGTNPFLFEPHSTTNPASNSVLNIVEQVGFSGVTKVLDPTRCKDHSFIQYDRPAIAFEANQAPSPEGDNLTGYGSYSGLSGLSLVTQNNETYIRTRCNQAGTGPGMWTTAAIAVVAGEKYRFIVKGYSLINLAYLFLEYNGEPVTYGPTLPIGANLEGTAVFEFTVPAGKTIMKYGVRWGGAQLNEDFFVNYISMQKATVLGTTQNNLYGQISKTENENATTWYSYDEFGLLEWTKQNIVGLGIKTIDYTYDYFGNITQVAYQIGQADKFYHHYVYDLNQRLTEVYTSLDGTNKTLHAKYLYYLHGPLKRVELANNLQGIDYVYTINGALKSINHSDVAKDPGGDGINGFSTDVFGQLVDYYDNDYTAANGSSSPVSGSGLVNQYNGLIRDISWFTPVDNPSTKKVYGYTYDNLYQLQNAQFGALTEVPLAPGTYNATLSANNYNEQIPAYDKNGNIQSLLRKSKTGTSIGNYAYNYVANTNKVSTITNGGAAMMSYNYNAIGQMIQQVEGSNTMNVTYNAYGLTKEVRNASNQLVVSYGYDDRGDRVKKLTYVGGNLNTTTYYVHDASGNELAIYQQTPVPFIITDLLEVPIYGAGRLGVYKPGKAATFYEINDHLGNVRAVIGPPTTDVYTATMESENPMVYIVEDTNFKNTIAPRIVSTAANNTPGGNEAIRINNGQPNGGYAGRLVGPGIKLKVAPGDVITAEVWGYHEGGTGYSNTLATSSIAAAVATLFGGVSGAAGDPGKTYSAFNQVYTGGGYSGAAGSGNDNIPAGYLNLVMFNNDLLPNPTELPMAAIPITAGAFTKQKLTIGPINIPAPGYVYIYVNDNSNSPNWVYFDDLKITHVHSPFVSGADYYPFGLTMSDREILTEPYRYGYQGQYAEEDSETGWNAFELRMYDARFGRWLSADPYGQFASPYVAMGNNPVSGTDPDGGFCPECDAAFKAFGGLADQFAVTATRWIPTLTEVATSAVGAIAAQTAGFTADGKHWQKSGPAIEPSYQPTQAQLDRWNRNDNWSPSINLGSIPSPSISIATNIQDIAGYAALIPGLNTAAGIVEAGAAIVAGDYWGAGFAIAGAIPVVGVAVKGAKLGFLGLKRLQASRKAGMQAHDAFYKIMSSRGWAANKGIRGLNGRLQIPDALAPGNRFWLELKPNTWSGRLAGKLKAARYKKQLNIHGRVVYYDPLTGGFVPF
jgi:RHS repeat-associated protein